MNEESNAEPVRRLVTLQRVVNLEPIDGKDRIELASILGYRCIVKKGAFKLGDLCAFHEVDSNVPTAGPKALPGYTFLDDKAKDCPDETDRAIMTDAMIDRPASDSPVQGLAVRRARIKTLKMGGVYSQGLALPLSELGIDPGPAREDDDVTERLGVTKYEPAALGSNGAPRPMGKNMRPWPNFAPPKTDEERLQSRPKLLDEIAGKVCYVTGKIDGSSMTLIRRSTAEPLVVCSRNFRIVPTEGEPLDIFSRAVAELDLASKIPPGYAVQGELAGPGIQKNRAGYPALRFCAFNVFRYFDEDDTSPEQLDFKSARAFCQDHRIQFVPVLWSTWLVCPYPRESTEDYPTPQLHDLAFFVKQALGQRFPNGNDAEGIVVRPEVPCESKVLGGRRLSFKVINPSFEAKT